MPWRDCTGRGVRVAVIDSGIHAGHPHIGGIVGGASICDEQDVGSDITDRIGHGTAVAAAIREKAPDAELYAVKVFDRTLSTSADRLIRAICWAATAGARVINLSLGTPRADHAARLSVAIAYATECGALIVAAEESDGIRWLPGSLAGVIAVRLDWTCPRDSVRTTDSPAGPRFLASGYPRPIPGVSPEANLKGISFAVANVSGLVARVCEAKPRATTADVVALLAS
jgi:subtilisin family serine protease